MNLKNTRSQKLLAKLEAAVAANAISNDGTSENFLPLVSATNPHKCDDKITPTYPIALKIPLSIVDNFKSHPANGKIKFIEVNSINPHPIKLPARAIKM